MDLRSGLEVGEGVGSSIVPLSCSMLGLFETGPRNSSSAFRFDRPKAASVGEDAGSPIVVSLSYMLEIPQSRLRNVGQAE